ncbi:bactofilin family protein [Gimibacter soli]|uniref:Polymer-forming cytoskeletal protein n=1 Tax=Gimibacter soli TaxID=3024400 RepID=A0AAE9XT58_9PROT|nr:polymer-forming cytoskeletal protein [Gimibacter soli]WCL52773.1 polymer-forming cytoskeletal protein [Gimibacter soli]
MASVSGPSTPSILSADVTIEGNVTVNGELQLDGTIKGDVVCGELVMGEHGSVTGTVTADSATIRGNIKGEVKVRVLRVEKSAVINGDLYQESLSVEAGAKLTGRIADLSTVTRAAAKSAAE